MVTDLQDTRKSLESHRISQHKAAFYWIISLVIANYCEQESLQGESEKMCMVNGSIVNPPDCMHEGCNWRNTSLLFIKSFKSLFDMI